MELARNAAKKILAAYPDYGKAPPEYIVNFIEALSHLSAEEVQVLSHPTTGLAARCKYLPTIADAMDILNEHRAKAEQFTPAHTTYRRFRDEDDSDAPWNKETDVERKKRVVAELLGYSPGHPSHQPKRVLVPATADDLRELKLKTPPAPPTPQLLALLREQTETQK